MKEYREDPTGLFGIFYTRRSAAGNFKDGVGQVVMAPYVVAHGNGAVEPTCGGFVFVPLGRGVACNLYGLEGCGAVGDYLTYYGHHRVN